MASNRTVLSLGYHSYTNDFIVPVYTTRHYERYESVHKIVHFGYVAIFG